MSSIIRPNEHDYQPHPGRIDRFRLLTDVARAQKGIAPKYLNFDFRKLPPNEYNAAYHFHRYAEEIFYMISGRAMLRTPDGLSEVREGDIIFFEAGESGAHQLYNHSDETCTYLDMRSYIGHDIVEYPDSDKIIVVPNGETFRRNEQHAYFDGETDIDDVWKALGLHK